MGRRYFCDYCNKTFIDDLEARKKHLSSSHHLKLRNLHYEIMRDPKIVLAEESVKTPCRRFIHTGICQFAGNCKYTHYTQEELWELKQQIQYYEYEKMKETKLPEIPTLESWLEKYSKQHYKTKQDAEFVDTFWSYSAQLEVCAELPPSMKKMQPEDFTDDHFEDWG